MDVVALFDTSLTPFQRLMVTWLFVIVGLVIAVQVAQTQAEEPLQWATFTKDTKRFWYTVYVLEAFLLVQSAYPILLEIMAEFANGYEEKILNTVWIGLLGLETLMVLGVAVQGIIKRYGPQPKQKTT